MTEIEIRAFNAAQRACLDDKDAAAATVGLAKWPCLAATPTFAIMGLLTGLDGSPMDRLCSSGPGAPLSGMVPMYALMSAFHFGPWLKLISHRRGSSHQSRSAVPRGKYVKQEGGYPKSSRFAPGLAEG
jgi:hypothetical protein